MRRKKNENVGHSTNKFLQIARDFIEVCPKCNSKHITVRRRKTPKYKCRKCDNEFDNPRAKIAHKTIKQQRDYGIQYPNSDK